MCVAVCGCVCCSVLVCVLQCVLIPSSLVDILKSQLATEFVVETHYTIDFREVVQGGEDA